MAEICCKVRTNSLGKRHFLAHLTPFIDKEGVLRVGGRLDTALVDYDQRHPIILPKNNVVKRYCRYVHSKIGHMGREYLISSLRKNLYIIGCSTLAKQISRECITCRKIHGKPEVQLMSDLPPDHLQADIPAFINTGIDFLDLFT